MARQPALPPAYFLGSLILMTVLHLGAPVATVLVWPWKAAGIVMLLYGVWMMGRSARLFEEHGTTIKPFEQSRALVTDGPYRISRNPMYLSMVIIQTAVAVLYGSVTPWLVIPAFMALITARFIRHEEYDLERRFGDTYRDYAARVRRWL